MTSCPSCGTELAGAARYCASCGAAAGGGDPVAGDGLFEVIDVSTATGSTPGSSFRGGGGFRWPWAVAAIVAVGSLGWMLTRSSDQAGQVEQSLGQNEESDEPTTTSRPRSSTTRRPTTTTTEAAPGLASVEGVAPGDPLLGEPTGLSLYVGGNGLSVIDLDSGVVTKFPTRGSPLLADEAWLILRSETGGIDVVPTSDPLAQSLQLADDAWYPLAWDGPDHVWINSYDPDSGPSWESVSVADGKSRTVIESNRMAASVAGPRGGWTAVRWCVRVGARWSHLPTTGRRLPACRVRHRSSGARL